MIIQPWFWAQGILLAFLAWQLVKVQRQIARVVLLLETRNTTQTPFKVVAPSFADTPTQCEANDQLLAHEPAQNPCEQIRRTFQELACQNSFEAHRLLEILNRGFENVNTDFDNLPSESPAPAQQSTAVCPICLEAANVDATELACGHRMHVPCFKALSGMENGQDSVVCPLCKKADMRFASPKEDQWTYD